MKSDSFYVLKTMPQYFPTLPDQVPSRGTAASRTFFQSLFFAQGWSFEGEFPNYPKAVAIFSPHTSNLDGWFGFLVIAGLGLKITILGKDSLFRPPFKKALQWAGFIPVKRNSTSGQTEQVIQAIQAEEKIWIAMAPEGTRKKAEKIKSGFYRIAQGAGIPITMFSIDYAQKKIYSLGVFHPTGDYQADLQAILACYQGKFSPKNPEWLALPFTKMQEKSLEK